MDSQVAEQMGAAIAILVAVSLALGTALGGLVTYLTESIKETGLVPDGYGGMVSLAASMLLGLAMSVFTKLMVPESPNWAAMALLGLFAGAIMAANAVRSFKAMGTVNTSAAYLEGSVNAEAKAQEQARALNSPKRVTALEGDSASRGLREQLPKL